MQHTGYTVIIIGIDPGQKGAVAVMHDGRVLTVFDMPLCIVKGVGPDGADRKRIDLPELRKLLLPYASSTIAVHAIIERPDYRTMRGRAKETGKSILVPVSPKRMGTLGENFATVKTMVYALFLVEPMDVSPGSWKKAMSLPADKSEVREIVKKWYPDFAAKLDRKRDDGRAEAIAMCRYLHQRLNPSSLLYPVLRFATAQPG